MQCIYLLSDDIDPKIQNFRAHHDPLGKLIGPHVTVVFPFKLEISEVSLKNHIQQKVEDLLSIKAQLGEIVEAKDGYVYFAISKGARQINTLHDSLYSGPLECALLDREYIPHITIGRAPPGETAGIMISAGNLHTETRFTLTKLVLERIGDQGESIPIAQYDLSRGPA